MCFINDGGDWTAEVVITKDFQATRPLKCDECQREIAIGAPVHHVYLQEYEACVCCFDSDGCDCPAPKDEFGCCESCQCTKPAFGETDDYHRCLHCHQFLQAVEAEELAAGCPEYEATPSYCMMIDEISENWEGLDNAKRYFKRAVSMFPELRLGARGGYLGWLWRKMFVHDWR